MYKSDHRPITTFSNQYNRLIPSKPITQELPRKAQVWLLSIELAVGIKERNESIKIIKRCSTDGLNHELLWKQRPTRFGSYPVQ